MSRIAVLFTRYIRFFKRAALPAILCSLFSFSLTAHKIDNDLTGSITGRVVDSLSSQPINYATITLLSQDKAVNGASTDDKGNFKLSGVAEGTYKMQIYFIGYQTATKNIVIGKTNPNAALGTVKLVNSQTTLDAVVVTAEKSVIENKIDKMVYNVDKDVTSQTGVATDVLKKVPQVEVDVDGNVELQGNSNIRFLIDGKPSTVYGSNITDVLALIPASQIQSIEIITSPGAKYDAEGTGGIINIILKKSTVEGINGNVSLTGGTRLENGSANLNVRHGTFGAHAYVSGNGQLNSTIKNSMDRTSMDSVTALQSSRLIQDGTSTFHREGYQAGVGFDWDVTPQNSITGSIGYNYFEYYNNGANNRQFITQDLSGNALSVLNDIYNTASNYNTKSYNYNLNYKKKFDKKDQELEIAYNYSQATNYSYYRQVQEYVPSDSTYSGSYGNNPGTSTESEIAVNYQQPLPKDVMLETGAKVTMDHIANSSDVYLLNPVFDDYTFNNTQSSSLDYKRNIYAYYISGSFKAFKLADVKAGLRDEYTDTKAFFSDTGNVTIAPYNTVVPSLVISRSLKKNQVVRLSYSHRIQRPDYRDLNPFINASDPKNITTGNTSLRPEVGDKIELSYNKSYEKGSYLNIVLFYRGNRDDIQSYTNYYPVYRDGDSTYTDVSVTTRQNVGREDNYGLNIYSSIPVTSKISWRTNLSGFQRYITTGNLAGNNIEGFNYRINMNVTYELNSTLVMEAFGNFNSARTNIQGTYPSFTTYNLAVRKQLFHKNGSVAFTATNPFSEYVDQKTELTGTNFTISNLRELPYRSFGVNFTYKFGKLEFKKPKEQDENSNPSQEN